MISYLSHLRFLIIQFPTSFGTKLVKFMTKDYFLKVICLFNYVYYCSAVKHRIIKQVFSRRFVSKFQPMSCFFCVFANQEAAMIRISADLLSLYIHVSFLCFLGKFLPVRVLFLYRNQKEKNSNLTRTDFYVHSC